MTAALSLEPAAHPPSAGPARGEPFFFGPPGARLFGWYLEPPPGVPRRGRAVLLSNPFGYEAMCLHRTYRALAAALCARGFPVLRFDHAGTGDSEGDDLAPGRVQAWLDGIVHAADELRARSGAAELAVFGVRLGATLALAAGPRLPGLAAAVAWAPYRNGKELVREVRAFRMLKEHAPPRVGGEGAEEAAGYLLTAETCRDLGAVDLSKLGQAPAPRILLLGRDDLADDGRLGAALEATGAKVDRDATPGYRAMMQDAFDSVIPSEAIGFIVRWLEEGAPAAPAAAPALPGARATDLTTPGGPVREEAIAFGPEGRYFGLLASPSAPAQDRPAVVLLNTGSNHHVGPNRLYVALARRLAVEGFHVLRMDVGGIGDSAVRPGGRENHMYSPRAPDDVRAAMDALTAHVGATRFVLMGICSGAYVAFHAAVADTRVVQQILVNLQTFDFHEGDSLVLRRRVEGRSTQSYRRLLLQPRTWSRLARGGIDVRWVLRVLGHRAATRLRQHVASVRSVLAGGRYEHSDVARRFLDLDDRGVGSLLVYAADDGGLDTIDQHLGTEARKMRGRPRFHLEVVPETDHTFTPTWSHPVLLDVVSRHLAARFPERR